MKKAVYAGSFDPITIGHEWVIKRAAELFDKLVVAVGENQQKKEDFSLEEKKKMLFSATKDYKNVRVDSFKGELLVDYAVKINASYIIRGIRTETDLEYEKGIQYINSRLNEDIKLSNNIFSYYIDSMAYSFGYNQMWLSYEGRSNLQLFL